MSEPTTDHSKHSLLTWAPCYASVVIGTCIGALAVWPLFDSSFPVTVEVMLRNLEAALGLSDYESVVTSDALRQRAVAVCLVVMTIVASCLLTGAVALRQVMQATDARRWTGGLWLALQVSLCVVYVVSWEALQWWSLRYRVQHALPQFRRAAEYLEDGWPSRSMVIPEVGYVVVDPDDPSRLGHNDGEYPIRETFGCGFFVLKAENPPCFMFALSSSANCFLYYCPSGKLAWMESDAFGNSLGLRRAVELEPGWYLVEHEFR